MDVDTQSDDNFECIDGNNVPKTIEEEMTSTADQPHSSLSTKNQKAAIINKSNNFESDGIACEEEVTTNLEKGYNQFIPANENPYLAIPSTSSAKSIASTADLLPSDQPVKRGTGRPRKSELSTKLLSWGSIDAIPSTSRAESIASTVDLLPSDQPVKRKPGRPRKSELATKLPTRVSTRVKKCPEIMTYEKKEPRKKWSNNEKLQLLKGLEKFGCDNIQGLKQYVTTRSEYQIKRQIRLWEKIAIEDLEKRTAASNKNKPSVQSMKNLNDWSDLFEAQQKNSASKQFALSIFFNLAAEYGKFPPPEACGGVDFRAMYRYIDCMLNGKPYFDLNPETAKVLVEMNTKLNAVAGDLLKDDLLQPQLYLYPPEQPPSMKTYPGAAASGSQKNQSTSKNPAAVLNLPDINPMKLPPHVLTKTPYMKTYPKVSDRFKDMSLQ